MIEIKRSCNKIAFWKSKGWTYSCTLASHNFYSFHIKGIAESSFDQIIEEFFLY